MVVSKVNLLFSISVTCEKDYAQVLFLPSSGILCSTFQHSFKIPVFTYIILFFFKK